MTVHSAYNDPHAAWLAGIDKKYPQIKLRHGQLHETLSPRLRLGLVWTSAHQVARPNTVGPWEDGNLGLKMFLTWNLSADGQANGLPGYEAEIGDFHTTSDLVSWDNIANPRPSWRHDSLHSRKEFRPGPAGLSSRLGTTTAAEAYHLRHDFLTSVPARWLTAHPPYAPAQAGFISRTGSAFKHGTRYYSCHSLPAPRVSG